MDFHFSIFNFGLRVRPHSLVALLALGWAFSARAADETQDVLVIVGAAGAPEYAAGFTAAAEAWRKASQAGGARCTIIGAAEMETEATAPEAVSDKARAQQWLDALDAKSSAPVWITYLGHGTFDGREARLNLRGPDVSAAEMQAWLAPVRRPLIFIDGGSASGPFLAALSAPGRIIVTATESGNEVNYARLGEKFAEAIADPNADLDQDGQTSVLEAFLSAAQRVQVFYAEAQRMATEHALIDDNGDKHGTPPDWFRGTRATKKAEGGATVDGVRAHRVALVMSEAEKRLTAAQRDARDRLEDELERLRERKPKMAERDYMRELEILMRKLSAIYQATPAPAPESSSTDS